MFLAPPMQAVPMVLVCTDRASRGIDSAHVEHVVLFDFPRDPSEYVRRAGRVSRGAGGTGLVSILVLGRQVWSTMPTVVLVMPGYKPEPMAIHWFDGEGNH